MSHRIELTAKTFGRLYVIGPSTVTTAGQLKWHCRCECGVEKLIAGVQLRRSRVVSCGCHRTEIATARVLTHGQSADGQTGEYRCWANMIQRCSAHARDQSLRNYFERGITVCGDWRESFESFFADMGQKPSPKHEIDRIDNDGNYEPGNCRWAVKAVQNTNKRNNDVVVYHGEAMVFKRAWESSSRVVSYGTAHSRHWRGGWPVDLAIDTPPLKSAGRRKPGSRHWCAPDALRRTAQHA